MNKTHEIIEKCKDRNFINKNKDFLKEYFKQQKSIEILKNELNTRRNYMILNILDKIDFPYQFIIPKLDNKNGKYLTQYMYSTIFWLYKKSYITIEQYDELKEGFKLMKNYSKMFEDTENHFIMYKVESDRKIQKQIKDDYNMKNVLNIRITKNYTGKYIYIINVDKIFDLGSSLDYDMEDSRMCISDIRNEYSRILDTNSLDWKINTENVSTNEYKEYDDGEIQNETLYNINKIRNRYHHTNNLYNKVDRILCNKLSKFYNNLLQIKKNDIEIKIVSECSLIQLLSEITFFKYEIVQVQDLYSVKNKQEVYTKIFKEYSDSKIVLFGEDERVVYDKKIWYLDIKYLSIINKVNKNMTIKQE